MRFNEDASAEYESEETVDGIKTALEQLGRNVILSPITSAYGTAGQSSAGYCV